MVKKPVSPCRGFDRSNCTFGIRLSQCQYAKGPQRQFCRKISKKRSNQLKSIASRANERKREVAVRRIQSRAKQGFQTPRKKHYKSVSEKRQQPSIYLFRQRCRLFPHPVEIFFQNGLRVPLEVNFANYFKKYVWKKFPRLIKEFLPPLAPNQHIHYPEIWSHLNVFPSEEYSSAENDIVIGTLYVKPVDKLTNDYSTKHAHLLFYEVRMNGMEGTPHAIVIDPNGRMWQNIDYERNLKLFFGDIPFDVLTTYVNNFGDGERHTSRYRKGMKLLGFDDVEGHEWQDGYCATISCFYLIDYVCTDQWKSRSVEHFVRASREWLFSPEENTSGFFTDVVLAVRANLFARYIAYRIILLLYPADVEHLMQNKHFVQVSFSTMGTRKQLHNYIVVNGKRIPYVDNKPMSLHSLHLHKNFKDAVDKKLDF